MTNLNCWTNPSETISISYCCDAITYLKEVPFLKYTKQVVTCNCKHL